MAVLRLGSEGAFRPKGSLPRNVPISDLLTETSSPFQVTLDTEEGAMTSNVTVAFRSPCSASVDPVMLAFRRRYGPATITEGTSVETSYGVLPVPRSLGDQNERAVSLSTTMTFVFDEDTTEMPEGVPVITNVPFDERALMLEVPETVGIADEAPEITASIV